MPNDASTESSDARDPLESLELPNMTLRGMFRHFGPGMILMMTGIGTSHLVTAPVAGGRFGYALLWCIPVAYVFKYYGFEMAFRFTHATGRSMLDAYSTAPKKWPLWYVMATTLVQCAVGQSGRLIAASAVVYYFLTQTLGWDMTIGGVDRGMLICGFAIGVASVVIILNGKYSVLELVTKIAAGLLVASALMVYLVDPLEPLRNMGHFFKIETPEGSWLLIAAFLGLLPTGIDVSLQASEWGKAKKVGTSRIRSELEERGIARHFDPFTSKKEDLAVDHGKVPPHAEEYCRRWFKIGLMDFRLGHVVSFFLACIFLFLAAVWIPGSEVSGTLVMGEIAGMFTNSVGAWMMLLFLLGAFAATFSTAFNYFDGWPRVVGACCRNLFRPTASLQGIARADLDRAHRRTWYSEYNIYRATMFYSLVASLAIISGVNKPVQLVLLASALAYFVAPVIYFLNLYYCFTVIPKKDKVFYPSTFATWFSWFSLAIFTGLTVLLIMARVFKVFG